MFSVIFLVQKERDTRARSLARSQNGVGDRKREFKEAGGRGVRREEHDKGLKQTL